MTTRVLVLHTLGDSSGGAPWCEALAGPGVSIDAPDLPGHGGAAPSIDGSYTASLVLLTAARRLALDDPGADPPVVLGVGASGWVALVLALSGRASAVALVDGLGGPWLSAREATAEALTRARRLLEDPRAMAPVPAGESDPRLEHPMAGFNNRRLAHQATGALRVPLLVVSSPNDPLSASDRDDLLGRCTGPVAVATCATAGPADVAPSVLQWLASGVVTSGQAKVPACSEDPG